MDAAPGTRHHTRTRPPETPPEATDPAIMDALVIRGGKPLQGRVLISGAKNAALPVMAATLLTPGVHTLRNVPLLRDTRTMADVLEKLGARIELGARACRIDTTNITSVEAPYDLVRTMRASIYVLGPLLARYGNARVSLPGGCAWGPRPVNLHLEGLKAMGAALEIAQALLAAGRCLDCEPLIWQMFEQNPARMHQVVNLIGKMLDAELDAEAVALSRKLEVFQRRRGERRSFITTMQEVVASHRASTELLEFLAELYNASNRESDCRSGPPPGRSCADRARS